MSARVVWEIRSGLWYREQVAGGRQAWRRARAFALAKGTELERERVTLYRDGEAIASWRWSAERRGVVQVVPS